MTVRRHPPRRVRLLREAERIDVAIYAAIAATRTPALDVAMNRLSRAADYSKISLAASLVLATTRGRSGRRAALSGLAAAGVTATVLNLGLKRVGRVRPDPLASRVPVARRVRVPRSTSFPSGHAGAAFAFAAGVGQVLPRAAIPLRAIAALIAYSRVHTGVHYPADVVAGALVGSVFGRLTAKGIAGIVSPSCPEQVEQSVGKPEGPTQHGKR